MNIALVAETAPAKTLIPIIEKLDDDEIISLTHDTGAIIIPLQCGYKGNW